MNDRLDPDLREGAHNLLLDCVGMERGDGVLLVGEEHARAFFDPVVCQVLAEAVRELGGRPTIVIAPETHGPEDFPDEIVRAMGGMEHTIFVSRLGDQIRFQEVEGRGTKTMCYLHDVEYLRNSFARVPYGIFSEVNDLIQREIALRHHCRITCPRGTDLAGPVLGDDEAMEDFSVRQFPVMIIPPIGARGLSGRLVLDRWLLSTSTHFYEESLLVLPDRLVAHLEEGRIVAIDGRQEEVARVRRHCENIASRSGGEAFRVHAWHAGTNPSTFFNGRAEDNIEKWADMVFGSPRYTHFHACGTAPGDVAISLFDTTISFDGEEFWKDGRLAFLDRPEVQDLAKRYPGAGSAFELRQDIGI